MSDLKKRPVGRPRSRSPARVKAAPVQEAAALNIAPKASDHEAKHQVPEFPLALTGHAYLSTADAPFLLSELKKAIPAHCFEKSYVKSIGYTILNLIIVAGIYYASLFIEDNRLPAWAPYFLWPIYAWYQGAFMTGLWVIAHECGHRAYSKSLWLTDCVGLMLHSCLLVPYHSWRISHSKHHAKTNLMDGDEVFVPLTKSEAGDHPNPSENMVAPLAALYRMVEVVKMLLFGWPTYLSTHILGRKYGKRTNHFEPSSPLFSPAQYWDIVISDLALLAVVIGLGFLGNIFGWFWLAKVYGFPMLFVNMWLVLITDLQHTDPAIPHYRGSKWTWLKGALCTVDRDYGFFNYVFHHIGDTHVAHHIFHEMPFYHAVEATAALKRFFKEKNCEEFYVKDNVSPGLLGILQATLKTTRYCRYVDDSGDILWWRWH